MTEVAATPQNLQSAAYAGVSKEAPTLVVGSVTLDPTQARHHRHDPRAALWQPLAPRLWAAVPVDGWLFGMIG
jgi:hypothetical protein